LISNISHPSETAAYAESKRKIGEMRKAKITMIIRISPILDIVFKLSIFLFHTKLFK
jgi:hypothetical protein